MKPENRQLLDDLLAESRDQQRAATLLAGNQMLGARRRRRRAFQTCIVIALLGVAAFAAQRLLLPATSATTVATAMPVPEAKPHPVKSLTDEELLALFPDTPVCLATLENGQKRLIFLRLEDAEKFMGRL